jgi:hypothetical protein
MLIVAVILEIAAVAFILAKDFITAKLMVIAWLSSLFVLYRVGLSVVGFRGYCQCLGSLTDWAHISPAGAQLLSEGILSYMFFGSLALLAWLTRELRKSAANCIDTPPM